MGRMGHTSTKKTYDHLFDDKIKLKLNIIFFTNK